MNEIMRRRRALMAAKDSYLTGYSVVGTPTITDGIMTPSADSWIGTPEDFTPTDKPWKLQFKITRQSGGGEFQNLISQAGLMLQADYTNVKLYLRSANSASFDICNGTEQNSMQRPGTTWVYIEFTGLQYKYGVSTDGETYTVKTVTSSVPIRTGKIWFGSKASNTSEVSASYDLNSTYINSNGKLWWKPIA